MTKAIISSICLFFSFFSSAQDTLRIYFDFGESEINSKQVSDLQTFVLQNDKIEIDSIRLVGMTDTVGTVEDNLILAGNRLRSVEVLINGENSEVLKTIYGEINDSEVSNCRRVEVIRFGHEVQPEKEQKTVCFETRFDIVDNCVFNRIEKDEETMFEILVQDSVLGKTQLFYQEKQEDRFIVKPVVWKAVEDPEGQSTHLHHSTVVPSDISWHGWLFSQSIKGCNECSRTIGKDTLLMVADSCYREMELDLSGIEIQRPSRLSKTVWVRVPESEIDRNQKFLAISQQYDSTSLIWETRKGSENQGYVFGQLPISRQMAKRKDHSMNAPEYRIQLPSIQVKELCCKRTNYRDGRMILDYCMFINYPDTARIDLELGVLYQFKEPIPYAALGFSRSGYKHHFSAWVGLVYQPQLYISGRWHYYLLDFMMPVSKQDKWQHISKRITIYKYARIYTGLEVKTLLGMPEMNLVEPNLHLGLAYVNAKSKSRIPRVFLQFGIGADLLKSRSNGIYPIGQFGVNIRLLNLKN